MPYLLWYMETVSSVVVTDIVGLCDLGLGTQWIQLYNT